MDCHLFESEIQEMLDDRRPVVLSTAAEEHCIECATCQEFFRIFAVVGGNRWNGLENLELDWEPFSSTERFDSAVKAALAFGTSEHVEHLASEVSSSEAMIPVAQVAVEHGAMQNDGVLSRTESGTASSFSYFQANRRRWIYAVAAASIILGAIGLGWRGLNDGGSSQPNPSIADSSQAMPPQSRSGRFRSRTNQNVDLNGIAAQVDQSAIAFDQGWHSLASSRKTAHQIPGIQPAIYPISGVVEALRENLIARHDSGQASGFRW